MKLQKKKEGTGVVEVSCLFQYFKYVVKGLRVLSLKVKDIVCEKKETTYKEVADSLVQTLNIKDMEMVLFNKKNHGVFSIIGKR